MNVPNQTVFIHVQHCEGVQCRMVLVVNFFVFLKLLYFCFVVAICDLVHHVEAIFYLP